jgi:choline dehydrogenase-like flavoprotein
MDFDHIIIGAGSAGCVLANRLSADAHRRVLLLEAGGRDWHPFIHMPAGLAKLVGHKGVNWDYSTEPEPHLDGRRLWWPRGKVLGGSSSINAMCYIRGVPADYDRWARLAGDPRWGWHHALPYFRRAEDNIRGADALHGAGGPLCVADLRHVNPLSRVFIDAAVDAGFARNEDFNGPHQEGFGCYQVTQRNGARCSAAVGYLRPARRRENLSVLTGVLVERVLIEGDRAVGVILRGGRRIEAGEVLLAGGALNSPQLLMLSGIGPAEHLREHGIEVHVDAPDVGGNLQDHLDICTLVTTPQKITYDRTNDLAVALEFLLKRQGIGTSNIAEAGGFVRTRHATGPECDMQFHFVPAQLDDHGRHRLPGHGYTLHACGLHPRSRGRLRLASRDPAAKVRIFANYLGDAEGHDLKLLIEGVHLSRRILAQTPFDAFRGTEIFPGDGVQDGAAIEAFVRRKAETIYHPVGTCRMGTDDRAVVDSELRVRGIDGLRVIDASAMPDLPGGNTNAPTIMIAEQAAELILGRVAIV